MGDIVGELHFNRISQRRLAEELGISEEWVSTVLNGKAKAADDMEQRMRDAIRKICEKTHRAANADTEGGR